MLLVVDTNILVNAIKSPGIKNTDGSIIPSKSQRLFIDILDGKHKLCVSSDIMAEYEDDRVFFDVARCLNVKLVTRNLSHYPVHELRTSIDELY